MLLLPGVPIVAEATLPLVPPTVAVTPVLVPVTVPVETVAEARPLLLPPPIETVALVPPIPTEAVVPPPLLPPTLTLIPPMPTLKAWLWPIVAPTSKAAEAAAIRKRDLITMLSFNTFQPPQRTTLNCYPLGIHSDLHEDLFKRPLAGWIMVSYFQRWFWNILGKILRFY
jgi:hypothetical protein